MVWTMRFDGKGNEVHTAASLVQPEYHFDTTIATNTHKYTPKHC